MALLFIEKLSLSFISKRFFSTVEKFHLLPTFFRHASKQEGQKESWI
jgi:hypothetical protein